jgi:DNA-binding NtrC family response regulator
MPQSSTRLRIFVVDDEFIIASSLALILCNKGYDAVSFSGPLDVLKAARSAPPDLLITDVLMPQISGIELAIQIQAQCPHCKVLLFSGQAATAGLLADARAAGHDFEILSKPVHPTDLLRKIKEATEDRALSSSSPTEADAHLTKRHQN